jgi:hypothetical protein
MFYVYVIPSEADFGLYIGMSGDLRRRFLGHQNGESRSTNGRRPWKLIYYEAYIKNWMQLGVSSPLDEEVNFLTNQPRHIGAGNQQSRVR